MDKDKKWIKIMGYGKRLGCHQMPERSFFFHGYQFPVCARCTGVLLASLIAGIVFWFYPLEPTYCVIFCAIMLCDWLFQHQKVIESTNRRRFITGLFGGYGCMTLQLYAYKYIVMFVFRNILSYSAP